MSVWRTHTFNGHPDGVCVRGSLGVSVFGWVMEDGRPV